MTFRYKKLDERQKDLQCKINEKISYDIHNVQQVLGSLVRERESENQDIHSIQYNNNTNTETDEQVSKNIINIDPKEDNKIIDYKTKPDWYASLLMYNSY